MPGKLVGIIVAAAAARALGGGASATELIYGAGIPAKSEEITLGVQPLAESLGKLSKGDLTMKVLAGGQVVSLQNTLANLRDGTIDAGFVVPAFTRKELKHVNVLYDTEVFGLDPAAITGAVNETILLDCPECRDDFRRNGALYLGSFGNNQKGLICRKPVKTVADVKGLKIRVIGASTRLIAAMGGVPVVMSPPDATTALERGTIDCVHGVMTWFKNFGYWDVAKYFLEAPLGSPRTISSAVFSRRAWNKLSAAQKKVAIDAVPMHLAHMVYDVNVDADRRLKERATKEKNVQFIEGGKDFEELMKKFRAEQRVEMPKIDAKNLGVPNADKIFDLFFKNLDKWNKIAAEKNLKDDKNAMAVAYKKEIYDKLDPSKL